MKPVLVLTLLATVLVALSAAPVKSRPAKSPGKAPPSASATLSAKSAKGKKTAAAIAPTAAARHGYRYPVPQRGRNDLAAQRPVTLQRAGTRRVVMRRMVHGRWVKITRVYVPPAPVVQQHPDPERYQQIQQALAARGYFKGEPNGEWNDDSVDALKRFQADRKQEPDGKINALSLIGLGLGPKHDGSSAAQLADPPSITPPPPAPAELPGPH